MNTSTKNKVAGLFLSIAILLVVGCQPIGIETGGTGSASTEAGSVTTIATPEPEAEAAENQAEGAAMISLSAVEQVIATRAVDALATELGVAASDVMITAMDSVEWPDASLGCPEEGMMYAAVLTSGYKIMLEANGQSHEYHSSTREETNVVKCDPKTGS